MKDLNNKSINTVSNKIRKMSAIVEYVYEKIHSNYKIARYMYYNTKNPNSDLGMGYDGNIIEQPTLTKDQIDEVITKLPFNPDIELENKNTIFINLPTYYYNEWGNAINVVVTTLVPIQYREIFDGMREFEISQEIANMFDCKYVDTNSVFYDMLGSMYFEITSFTHSRLSTSTNFCMATIGLKIDMKGSQYRYNNGNS